MRNGKFKEIASKSIAASLTIWLSGVVLLFCCTASKAAPVAVDFCPMAKMPHHCDMDMPDETKAFTAPEPICVNCDLLPVVFDKARKIEAPQKQVATPAAVPVIRISLTPNTQIAPPRRARYTSRFADKSRTFIATQVFRC